jgi:hypothetical protein
MLRWSLYVPFVMLPGMTAWLPPTAWDSVGRTMRRANPMTVVTRTQASAMARDRSFIMGSNAIRLSSLVAAFPRGEGFVAQLMRENLNMTLAMRAVGIDAEDG